MCGITGIVHLDGNPVSPVILRRMTDAISHRGPDDEGWWIEGAAGLGARRLSIIDLSPAGHQPMVTTDGRFVISYNGEVYNFQELRAELASRGIQFRSRTDTEVVLNALATWGVEALTRLNGMFSLALWDNENKELLLARDRYGIKPLYYATSDTCLLFGSEVKAMLAHPALQAEMDLETLYEYFTFQNVLTERTLFRGVKLLSAGSFVRMSLGEGVVEAPKSYWDFNFSDPGQAADDRDYLEELDRLFRQAVTRQLVADVPVGSYLSGGMDSGSITAIAAREVPNLRTFTVGFDLHSVSGLEIAYDERQSAERLSYLCGTEHYEMVLKAGDLERVMPLLTWHLEDPRVGQCYPNFFAAKLAGSFGKVVLSGTGGDELFGGYPWRYYRAVVNDDFDDYIDKYYLYWQRLLPNAVLMNLFAPVADAVKNVWTRDIMRGTFKTHSDRLKQPEDYINHSLYFEAKTFLHGLLLVEDKLSMAHGLETRVPFLDNDLVDFAQRVPVSLKLGNLQEVIRLNENEPGPKTKRFFERTRDGKLILRKMLRKYVPDEVAQREKQGFAAPDASWFRGESIDWVRKMLLGDGSRIYDYLDPEVTYMLLREHFEGRVNRRLLIWSLISIEQWCRTFLDGERA